MHEQETNNIDAISIIYPYFLNTLYSNKGKRILVETMRNSDTGYLLDVFPDHIMIKDQIDDPITYILISQIISIMILDRN